MKFRDEINESLTLAFAEAARERREQGLSILSLGLGEPDFETPKNFVQAVTDVLSEGNSRYSSANGIFSLKEKISEKLTVENKIQASPANVVVCAGAKPALSLALMAMLEPNDEVIVVSPSFVSFVPQVLLAEPDVTVRRVPLDPIDMSLPLEKIRGEVNDRTRAIIINTPNNPAGSIMSKQSLTELYELACERDFYIISDEVYEKLTHNENDHFSIGSLESEVSRVVTINGFSKSHALTGWRLGYACVPSQLLSKITKIQQHMYTNTCTFVQDAVARAWDFECPHLDGYKTTLKNRVQIIEDWVSNETALTCQLPKAGFFAFFSINAKGVTSNEFCASLLSKTGVATTPGLAFGPEWDNHFRVSFAVPEQDLRAGLTGISDHLKAF